MPSARYRHERGVRDARSARGKLPYRPTPPSASAIERARATILQTLDTVRVDRGLTKAELATRIGVEPAAIRRLFSAPGQNPTLNTLVRIAKILRLELVVRATAEAR